MIRLNISISISTHFVRVSDMHMKLFPLYVEHLLRYFYFGREKDYSAV